jgi:hypothetical protein
LVLIDPWSITVRGGDIDTTSVLASSSIVKFERSRGKHPALVIGAPVVGGLLGAALGPMLITESTQCSPGVKVAAECRKETADELVGAIVGALAFGLVGGAIARERWQEVPLERLFFDVRNSSLHMGVSVRF